MNEIQKQAVAKYITANCPEKLLEQFVRLTELYTINQENLTKDLNNKQKFDNKLFYINNSYNTINLIIKYIAVSAGGEMGRVSLPKEVQDDMAANMEEKINPKPAPQKVNDDELETMDAGALFDGMGVQQKTMSTEEPSIGDEDPSTGEEILFDQIDKWNIFEGQFMYDILTALLKIDINTIDINAEKAALYSSIIKAIANEINRTPWVVSSRVSTFVKHTDFYSNAKHIPEWQNPERDFDITKELFIIKLFKIAREIPYIPCIA